MAKSLQQLESTVQKMKAEYDRKLSSYTAELNTSHDKFSRLANETLSTAERLNIFRNEMEKKLTQILGTLNTMKERKADPAPRPAKKARKKA